MRPMQAAVSPARDLIRRAGWRLTQQGICTSPTAAISACCALRLRWGLLPRTQRLPRCGDRATLRPALCPPSRAVRLSRYRPVWLLAPILYLWPRLLTIACSSFALASGGPATSVLGQTDFVTTTANTGSTPLASANSLSGPSDVKVDAAGNVFVADTGNNRLLQFAPGAKAASKVWGQLDFMTNGANQIKPGSINFPFNIAIDYSSAPYALYVSDTGNNRVLGWRDSVRFRSGDPADFVIGQPNLRTGVANVDTRGSTNPSNTSLSAPEGLAIDPSNGTLYRCRFG